jgi:hypothetical protein
MLSGWISRLSWPSERSGKKMDELWDDSDDEVEEGLESGPPAPLLSWPDILAGQKAYSEGKSNRPPLTLLMPYRRRSWREGWQHGRQLARKQDRQTLASAIAEHMEAVEAYGESLRLGAAGLDQAAQLGASLRVVIQAAGRAPHAALEEPL